VNSALSGKVTQTVSATKLKADRDSPKTKVPSMKAIGSTINNMAMAWSHGRTEDVMRAPTSKTRRKATATSLGSTATSSAAQRQRITTIDLKDKLDEVSY